MSCTCESPQTVSELCYNQKCGNMFTHEMTDEDKMSECPVHNECIAICDRGTPYLCDNCKSDGYHLKATNEEDFGGTIYALLKN